jgi:GxxExxY protein
MPDVFKAQVISYLKASGLEVGLLINFGNESLDVRRLVRYKDYIEH